MSQFMPAEIRGIVFDLDGTLYVCKRFAAEIQNASVEYIAGVMQISLDEAGVEMAATRQKLSQESGITQTISAVCTTLGGNVQDLHRFFEQKLRPEAFLVRDERVTAMLERLAENYSLYIYTNNNRVLTARIMDYLGLDGLVRDVFTINDSWRGKPDEGLVRGVLGKIGLAANEALFVGDRYDVDLRVPEQLGCPVYLSRTLEQLLRLEALLIKSTSSDTPVVPAYPQVAQS